ncbi:MAG: hypothetical protein ACJ8F1_17690 [Polyangia bacterium]
MRQTLLSARLIALFGLAGVGVACSGSPAQTTGPGATVTFHKDVEPILQKHCDMCHVANGIAPMPLVTYADAKAYAGLMTAQTSSRAMPPWGAVSTPGCTPPLSWKDNPVLSDQQIATFGAWSAAGAPEGDPADAPPALTPQPIALAGTNADLSPPAPWTLTSPSADEFRCFVLDPQLAKTTYLNGSFVVPGDPQVVHHALVFSDPKGASRALVTDQATQSYDCFGGPGISQVALLAAWAPGGLPTDYPSNVGAPLDAGTLLVMQVHYHPHQALDSLPSDQTHFQMRLVSAAPQYVAYTILPGNFRVAVDAAGNGLLPGPDDPAAGPAFVIPAGVSGHTETMQFTLPSAVKNQALPASLPIFSIGGHQHYVGSAVQVNVHHVKPPAGTDADQCLLAIPHWDFDWQRVYRYDAPIDQLPAVGPGDVMTIRCTYDNTMGNPKLAASLHEQGLTQPQNVQLGETTLDEMCLAPTVLLAKVP